MLVWSPLLKNLKPCAICTSWPRMEALPFPGHAASPDLVPMQRSFISKNVSLPSSSMIPFLFFGSRFFSSFFFSSSFTFLLFYFFLYFFFTFSLLPLYFFFPVFFTFSLLPLYFFFPVFLLFFSFLLSFNFPVSSLCLYEQLRVLPGFFSITSSKGLFSKVGLDRTVPVALRIFQFVLGLVWGVLVILGLQIQVGCG